MTKTKRRSISISGKTYELLRGRCDSIGGFIENAVREALDDPKVAARVLAKMEKELA